MRNAVLFRLPGGLHAQVKERARALGISVNTLLERFVAEGLRRDSMSDDVREVIGGAKARLGDKYLGLVLFGSRARGDASQGSDTDLLIIVDRAIPIRRELYRNWPIDDQLSLHFAHLPATSEEAGSLWLECALDGIVLDDTRGAVAECLNDLKQRIASGKVVRKITHGQGYWVHQ